MRHLQESNLKTLCLGLNLFRVHDNAACSRLFLTYLSASKLFSGGSWIERLAVARYFCISTCTATVQSG